MSDGDYECPAQGCGYTSESEAGIKIHYGRMHEGSIAGIEVECGYCDETFRRERAAAEAADRVFCPDSDCYAKFLSENVYGENHPGWGGRVEVECAWCGTSKKVRPSELGPSEQFFCGGDTNCESAWKEENWNAENNNNWRGGKVEVECEWCGETKNIKPSIASVSDYYFCANNGECKGAYYADKYGGEDTPNWRGGYEKYYGESWPKQREKALTRDDYQCVICGMGKDEWGRNPHVHHIVPFREFDSEQAAHQLGNLITLCNSHHSLAENGRVETPIPDSPLTPQPTDG